MNRRFLHELRSTQRTTSFKRGHKTSQHATPFATKMKRGVPSLPLSPIQFHYRRGSATSIHLLCRNRGDTRSLLPLLHHSPATSGRTGDHTGQAFEGDTLLRKDNVETLHWGNAHSFPQPGSSGEQRFVQNKTIKMRRVKYSNI